MRFGSGELRIAALGGMFAGLVAAFWGVGFAPAAAGPEGRRAFALCHSGGGVNCVVDGDTIWMDSVKIRIADIDAPEIHPSRCAEEDRLGRAATLRLQALLNAGPIRLAAGDRDTDRYGRKLRIVMRGKTSLGEVLVSEGLARKWTWHRRPWC